MRLSEFLVANADEILREWDAFAATVEHAGKELDKKALRDHAAEILHAIAVDLAQPQSADEQDAKGKGLGVRAVGPSAAETHADYRMLAGFAIDAMITEYRALRASVMKIWGAAGGGASKEDLRDLTRFNEAIDQAIAESVARYTRQTRKATELFIGILGHDIRNPLGTILMGVEVLIRTGQLSAKAAAPVVNSAVRINSIIEQVVDFTRAQADGVMPIVRSPGNLADHIFKVVQETQVRHPGRTLQLRSTGNFDGSWDEGRIGQLLSNLLGNAFLYGARDSVVSVEMSSTQRDVTFSVHNTGDAIPAGELKRIFEPMARGTLNDVGGERREPAGLGLGLYICREIVLSHNGSLRVESTEVDGTTFSVTMPRYPDPARI
jgi:signal transduction histidine kinase